MKRRLKRGTGKPLKRGGTNAEHGIGKSPVYLPVAATQTTHANGKTSPVQVLESAVATRRKSQAELSALGKSLADKSARLATLEITGDLNDAAVLTELVQLQISTGLLPRRIAVKEECDANAAQALTQATNQFIRQHLGPRVRRLAARTRAIVKSELSSHFRDAATLLIAVDQSERVRGIESLSCTATGHPPRGALEHAQGTLNAWAAVDKFETTHLNEPQRHDAVVMGSAPAPGAVNRAPRFTFTAQKNPTVR